MERFIRRLAERLKPVYVRALEAQTTRFVSDITFGGRDEKLLDAREKGLLLYHHGPERRVKPGFPVGSEEPTGKEYVFLEYHNGRDAYHIVGNVGPSKQFTFLHLERYGSKGYRGIPVHGNREIIREVTDMLGELEPSADRADDSA